MIYFLFSEGWILEWRGKVREYCDLRERQQRHLWLAEQNLYCHHHFGKSVIEKRERLGGLGEDVQLRWASAQRKINILLCFAIKFLKVQRAEKIEQTYEIISPPFPLSHFYSANLCLSQYCLVRMTMAAFRKPDTEFHLRSIGLKLHYMLYVTVCFIFKALFSCLFVIWWGAVFTLHLHQVRIFADLPAPNSLEHCKKG